MSALPPQHATSMRKAASQRGAVRGSLGQRWQELHRQASRLAKLAQLSPEPFIGEVASFPDRISGASERHQELAWQGIEDIDAMMQPGLTALATIAQRGHSAHAPALALWREFHSARASLLALAEQLEEDAL